MQKLSKSQRESLQRAVTTYHSNLAGSPAEEFLNSRSLDPSLLEKFRFGYVEEPLPGHEMHQGKLAIPYLRRHPRHGWTCVSIRFRALDNETKPKYASLAGDRPRVYNTLALTEPVLDVGIAEGELDAVSATLAGLPTVGIPGASSWQSYWRELFLGYRTVYVFTDGDEPGEALGRRIGKDLPNAKVIHCPSGEDVNSIYANHGAEELQKYWKEHQ